MLIKDTAICIRAVDYSETSQIVTFFARAAGKISAIAKGSKRPKSAFDGPIEIFSYGKIVFSDSNKEKLATLTEFAPAPALAFAPVPTPPVSRQTQVQARKRGGAGFTNLSSNLFTMNCCLFSTELLNKLTHDYDPHPALFDDFLQFLENIQNINNKHQMLALLILFQLSLLKEVGLRPVLNACANCKTQYAIRNTQYEVYFSSSANGLVCRDCEGAFPDRIRLTEMAANCLANLKLIDESQEKTLIEIETVLVHHFTEILGRKPKMAKYILNI